jgi:phosphoserine aminotransferase
MLCVADYLDALNWVENLGGVNATIAKSKNNLAVLESFVEKTPWIHFLADTQETRSNTSVCFTVDLPADKVKQLIKLLEEEAVAYDIGSYRDAPAGLRIWAGATIERFDLETFLPWLEWAYNEVSG